MIANCGFRNMGAVRNLIDSFGQNERLFKLKLSMVNLNDSTLVAQICSLICGVPFVVLKEKQVQKEEKMEET